MKDNQHLTSVELGVARPQSPANPSHCILVADDEPFICRLIGEVLTRQGYQVNAVGDGATAWEALNADTYNLLITDNNMPQISGVELLKKLRAVGMALPVIMVTGAMPEDEFARYPWLRPEATLLKPFTIADMLGTVKKVLREAGEKSAYFQSLSEATQQLNFDWESLTSRNGNLARQPGRSSV